MGKIVVTPVGLTDLSTGEIISPPKIVRTHTRRARRKSDPQADSGWFIAVLALLVACMAFMTTISQ